MLWIRLTKPITKAIVVIRRLAGETAPVPPFDGRL
jgi:hypothetical protein